ILDKILAVKAEEIAKAKKTLGAAAARHQAEAAGKPRDFIGALRAKITAGLPAVIDRKSTRLNSSHEWISYAVFCLKKKTRRHKRWRGDLGPRPSLGRQRKSPRFLGSFAAKN